jgi:chemotaxis protein MotB
MSTNSDKIKPKRVFETSRAPIWVITYADMMTNLMLFFLVLFAFTRMDSKSQDKMSKTFKSDFSNTQQTGGNGSGTGDGKQEMSDENIKQEAGKVNGLVDANEERIKFSLSGEVLFDLGSAELKSEAKKNLLETIKIFEKIPNTIIVEGYTDNIPIKTREFSSNWELSLARAESVLNFIAANGIPANRLCIAGYGEYKPIVPNTDEISRAKNRRIEISILKRES